MTGIIRNAFCTINVDEKYKDISVNDLEDKIKRKVEKYYELLNGKEYTPRYFLKAFNILGLSKKYREYAKSFNGMDKKIVCIFFIQDHISKLLNNIEHNAKNFKKEEENKTNRKHLQQRKKVITCIHKIENTLGLFHYELKVSYKFTFKEKLFFNKKYILSKKIYILHI